MIVAVDAGGYVEAVDAFRTGNHAAAEVHAALVAGLASAGGMAGDDAAGAEFAAAYDSAAAEAVAAIGEVAAAYATLGRLSRGSLGNHRAAERRSVLPGGVVAAVCAQPVEGRDRVVLATTPPTALGGDAPSWSPEEAWVLDHLEGFVWPDADVVRLRAAAQSWRRAAQGLDGAAAYAGVAIAALEHQRSPEVPLAIDVTSDLGRVVGEVTVACTELAGRCEAYADEVEARHAQIRGLVHEVLRMVVEGMVIGAVLAGITAGAGAAVGVGSIVVRVAAQSPRFAAVLAALRATTAGIAASLRTTRGALTAQRTRLERFLRVPVRTERGSFALGAGRSRKGWLSRHERAGGHTLSRHVGKTEQELLERIRAEGLPRASSFRTADEAEHAIESTLKLNSAKLDNWLSSADRQLTLNARLSRSVGISATEEGIMDVAGVRIVLRKADLPEGFRVHTAFPEP